MKDFQLPESLQFLKSTRFWAMIFAAVVQYLQAENIVSPELATLLTTIFGGFVGVRTIDRFGEKVGEKTVNVNNSTLNT